MSFFDLFKKADTKELANHMRRNENDDPIKEALNNLFSEEDLEKALSNTQTSLRKGEEYYLKGNEVGAKGNLNEAIKYFNKSIKHYDAASGPYSSRGYIYKKLGKYENAVKDFKIALALELEEDIGNRSEQYEIAKYWLEELNKMGYQ